MLFSIRKLGSYCYSYLHFSNTSPGTTKPWNFPGNKSPWGLLRSISAQSFLCFCSKILRTIALPHIKLTEWHYRINIFCLGIFGFCFVLFWGPHPPVPRFIPICTQGKVLLLWPQELLYSEKTICTCKQLISL